MYAFAVLAHALSSVQLLASDSGIQGLSHLFPSPVGPPVARYSELSQPGTQAVHFLSARADAGSAACTSLFLCPAMHLRHALLSSLPSTTGAPCAT